MNHMLRVFTYELKRNFQRRGYLFSAFGLPLIGLAIYFVIQATTSSDPQQQLAQFEFDLESTNKAGYVDLSGQFQPPSADSPIVETVIPYVDEVAAQAALNANEIDVYYVIPTDYAETGDLRLVMPRFALSQLNSTPFENLFYSQLLEQVDLQTLSLLANPAVIERVQLQRPGESEVIQDESVSNSLTQIFAIVLVLALLGTNGYLMQSIIEEKETQLIEILISSVRPWQLLTGKIIALGVLGIVQVAFYILVISISGNIATDNGGFLANIQFEADVLVIAFVFFLVGYLLYAAAFGAVGAISNSVTEAPTIAFIFIFPAMLPWIFASEIASNPSGTLSTIMSFFPLTSPMAMVMRVSVSSVPFVQILISLVILSISVVLMLLFAARLFRVQILLAGKRPRLKIYLSWYLGKYIKGVST